MRGGARGICDSSFYVSLPRRDVQREGEPTMVSKAMFRTLERLEQTAKDKRERAGAKKRALAATSDTFEWVTKHTQTYNEHWVEEGRPSPYEPFPPHDYFRLLFDALDVEPVV